MFPSSKKSRKSSQLIHKNGRKKYTKSLNNTRRCWLRTFIMTILIGFIVLFTTINMDFFGIAQGSSIDLPARTIGTANTTTYKDIAELERTTNSSEMMSRIFNLTSYQNIAQVREKRASPCFEVECKVTCYNEYIVDLDKILDPSYCNELDLVLQGCKFAKETLRNDFFHGVFHLRNLTFSNCKLYEIQNGAFKRQTVKTVKNLIFTNTHLRTLNAATFEGLTALNYFELNNPAADGTLEGTNFLTPMSKTLNEILILQHEAQIVHDPKNWLTGATFDKLLRVDLSGNNVGDTLNSQTFVMLVKVRTLILKNCGITTFGADTFQFIMATLQYLDLSNNALVTVSDMFLSSAMLHGVHLNLYGNEWNCACDNYELITYIKETMRETSEEPKCTEPKELRDVRIKDIAFNCDITISTTTPDMKTTISTSDAAATTTTTPKTTDDSTNPTSSDTAATATSSLQTDMKTTISTSDASATTTTPKTTDDSTSPTYSDTAATPTSSLQTLSTTTPSSTIPSSSSSSSTDPNDNQFIINCPDTNNSGIHQQHINKYDVLFYVEKYNASSVLVVVQSDMKNFHLIYFKSNQHQVNNAQNTHISRAGRSSATFHTKRGITSTVLHVNELVINYAYVFCIAAYGDATISPYNCRSHFLAEYTDDTLARVWLLKTDMVLVISIVCFVLLVLIGATALCIYFLLRRHPTWLKGSKRLLRKGKSSSEVYLIPKSASLSIDEECAYNEFIKKHPSIIGGAANAKDKSNDYMQFYRNAELVNSQKLPTDVTQHLSPADYAPDIPSCSNSKINSRPTSTETQTTVRIDDIMSHDETDEDHEYECIDHYMKIYN